MAELALMPAEAPDKGMCSWRRLTTDRNWLGLWFMVPAAAFLILFLAYPLVLGIWISFTDARIGENGEFVGLENYEWLSDDSVFWLSVFNTLLYTAVASVIKFGIGLYLALLLNEHMPFKALVRAVVLIPFIVPTVLSAMAFWWLFDAQFSVISWSLRHLGLISGNIDFLGDPQSLADIPPRHLSDADSHRRRGDDFFGAVHLHRLPAHLGADARRAGQRHPTYGDAILPARHSRRPSRRGRCDLLGDDPVPPGRDSDFVVRPPTAQMAAGREQ